MRRRHERTAWLDDRLGGRAAIQAVVDDFVARVVEDARVKGFARAASDPERAAAYKAKLVDLVCQVAGGPCKYTRMDMVTAHKDRGVTAKSFDALVAGLVGTLDELKVRERKSNNYSGCWGHSKQR